MARNDSLLRFDLRRQARMSKLYYKRLKTHLIISAIINIRRNRDEELRKNGLRKSE